MNFPLRYRQAARISLEVGTRSGERPEVLRALPFVLSVGSEGAEVEGWMAYPLPFDFGPFPFAKLRTLRSGRTEYIS